MADTPSDANSDGSSNTPKRGRRRQGVTADGAKAAAKPRGSTRKAAAGDTAETKSARTAKSGAAATRKASTSKSGTTGKRAASATRAIKSAARDVAKPVTGKRVAIGAAVAAGVAAGVAAVLGRKKIAKVSTDAIETITGKSGEAKDQGSGSTSN